ncbi:unnamed protein product [Alopecurus aequalis]
MASLGLRSAARLLRRSISGSAGKTQPTKHSTSSEFNMGHGQHIQQDCQPNRSRTCIMSKLDEHSRILRATREDIKFLQQRADEEIAWDKLQKRVLLPSAATAALAFYAYKNLFGEPRQEMLVEIKPPN